MNKKHKKILSYALSFFMLFTSINITSMINVSASTVLADDLFFSEYLEGSSQNKAIEIFNGTGQAVDLSNYTIELYTNANVEASNTLTLSGTLENNSVYVICNDGSADTLKDKADIKDDKTVTGFNGNDSLVLKNKDKIVDSFGKIAENPKDKWSSNGCSTKDMTLIRKKHIKSGDTDPNDTFDPSEEWEANPKDTFDYLGSHVFDGSAVDNKVSRVTANPSSGMVTAGTEVTLSTVTTGTSIHFTIDGSEPTEASPVYAAPITINEATTIKTFASKEGMDNSNVSTFSYTIKEVITDTISIAEARQKAKGTELVVEGIVTCNEYGTYIQDDTAGIALSIYGTTLKLDNLKQGNKVKVTGAISENKGLLQITLGKEVEILEENAPLPEPKVITVPQANSEEFEGQLIKLQQVKLGKQNGKYTPLVDGDGNAINVYSMPQLEGISEGTLVDVVAIVTQYTNYQLKVRSSEDVTKAYLGPDVTAPVIEHTAVTEGNVNTDLTISAKVTDDRDLSYVKLYYRTKGTEEFKALDMTLNKEEYCAVISKSELDKAGLEYYMETSDGTFTVTFPADKAQPLQVAISDADIIAPVVTEVTPANGKCLEDSETTPEIKASYEDESNIDVKSVKLTLDDADVTSTSVITENSVVYVPSKALELGKHTVKLEVADTLGNLTTKTWYFSIGKEAFTPYFGQLHSHTNYSDGKGTGREAFEWARDKGNVDYFAITDHSNWFDNDGTENETITDISQSTSEEWKDMHKAADEFNKNGEFVAIAGYEMTWSGSTGGWGHMNTFNTPWFASRNNSKMDLPSYYNRVAQDTNSISQLNHPGKTFGDFADFSFYSEAADNVVNLVEVGNGEGPIRGSGYFPSYEYYTRALDKGWHVAPTNNQDNHKGNWITSNEARTVILAPELTRDSIYDAIRAKRVYATEDRNLKINYTLNGAPMGTSLDEPKNLDILVDISDENDGDNIKEVQIISNGGIIAASKTFSSNVVNWTPSLEPQYNYYYVKVIQEDGDIAVTAPVWTSKLSPVGLSKVTVSQDIVETNAPVDIEATVFNNSENLIGSTEVTFYKNEILPENKIGQATVSNIAQGATAAAKITWSPEAAGSYKIYAAVTINVDGINKTSTVSTALDVMNKEEVVKVVIDGGHVNQYVSGNYPGKLTGLKSLLKDNTIMAVENNDELTAEDLKDASILVITSPQPTDYEKYKLTKSKLSDAEIEVVRNFVAAGGSLILTSRADYNDGVDDYQNAVQANKVLEAVQSNLRINDAQVIDNTNNAGFPYKLMLKNFTSSKFNLTAGSEVSDHEFSFYSGTSVMLKENGDDSKVDFLVKGHDTTELSDADKAGDVTATDKGNVYVLAAEELPGGGKVIAAGSTFFSDFEITGDNINSNVQITKNIINWLKPTPNYEFKTIAEVREDLDKNGKPDHMGKTFTIEGRVTAESEAYKAAHGRNNSFFEVLYVQDETAGITVFGSSKKEVPLGAKVRITGFVDEYQGDAEIQIRNEETDLIILDDEIEIVPPTKMSTGDSMLEENEGTLVEIEGKVVKFETESDNSIFIDDGTGLARVFVEGYIGDGTDNKEMLGKWDSSIKVGDTVKAIGLASEDPEGHRLRVRNTAEIVKVDASGSNDMLIENITNITEADKHKDFKMTIKATNTSKEDKVATLIVTLVDNKGELTNYVASKANIKAGESSELTGNIKMLPNTKYIKCYVWDSLENMKPLSKEIVIPVK